MASDGIDEAKLGAFKGALLQVAAGALALVNMGVGDALGLYKCLAKHSPAGISAGDFAKECDIDLRYAQDWLVNQTLNGIIMRTGDDGVAGTGT